MTLIDEKKIKISVSFNQYSNDPIPNINNNDMLVTLDVNDILKHSPIINISR